MDSFHQFKTFKDENGKDVTEAIGSDKVCKDPYIFINTLYLTDVTDGFPSTGKARNTYYYKDDEEDSVLDTYGQAPKSGFADPFQHASYFISAINGETKKSFIANITTEDIRGELLKVQNVEIPHAIGQAMLNNDVFDFPYNESDRLTPKPVTDTELYFVFARWAKPLKDDFAWNEVKYQKDTDERNQKLCNEMIEIYGDDALDFSKYINQPIDDLSEIFNELGIPRS